MFFLEARWRNISRGLWVAVAIVVLVNGARLQIGRKADNVLLSPVIRVHAELKHDVSPPLALLMASDSTRATGCEALACGTSPGVGRDDPDVDDKSPEPIPPPIPPPTLSPAGMAVEQTSQGPEPPVPMLASFDGLGAGFSGPQGTGNFRNPSDNSLAVGPDHIVQTVNTRLAVFSKKGKKYGNSGLVLYGPVPTNAVWAGFGGVCQARNNGDAVVRYDQLAGRWLIVMPIFSRIKPGDFPQKHDGETILPGQLAKPGERSRPGASAAPPANPPQPPAPEHGLSKDQEGVWAMCYAVSTGADPLGPYYRYAFERTLFPDYPRPAIWPDGYYVPTSTGDDVIQKHACVADRTSMLKGEPATEQCLVVEGVNFLNNADIDGPATPPLGTPNIMMAAGGTQLKERLRGRWHLLLESSRRLGESGQDQSRWPHQD